MFESIKKVKEQFGWVPEISGSVIRPGFRRVIVCGMGGSNIASGFLEMLRPDLEIVAHRSYGLPVQACLPENASKDDLIIISSYSGNTEEALDSFEKALAGGFQMIAISTGGELLRRAKEGAISFIEIPLLRQGFGGQAASNLQPRMALGYSLLAMLKAVGDEENLKNAQEFGKNFNPDGFEKEGMALAEKLQNKIPVIYSSWDNKAIAYAWKIKLNETAKIPAFFNVFPEINHNEMMGFLASGAAPESVGGRAMNPYFIFLEDPEDHPGIQKRMKITQKMFEDQNHWCHPCVLVDSHRIARIFNSLALADWTAYYLAKNYGVDPEQVLLVEEFKKRMKE